LVKSGGLTFTNSRDLNPNRSEVQGSEVMEGFDVDSLAKFGNIFK